MNRLPVLLLFDVDGTLTYSAGLTRVAFDRAIEELYQVQNSTRGIEPFGRTDQWIFRRILENNSLSEEDFPEQFSTFSSVAARCLNHELNASDKPRLHNGVANLLRLLADVDNLFLALGTGNIKENALLKIKRHGIDHYFPVGGFGSDSEDRSEILDIAYRRACEYYGKDFLRENTWVIGDTPLDIKHGKEIEAKTIAVATGTFDIDELLRHSPDAVFEDFSDVHGFLNTVDGNHL